MIIPWECHSVYSIQEGFAQISTLIAKAVELKLPAIALTDTHSVSGAVEFFQEIEKSNKKNEHKIRGVLGAILNTDVGKLHTICRNKVGYYNLLKALATTSPEGTIDYDNINQDGLIFIAGDNRDLIIEGWLNEENVYRVDPDEPERDTPKTLRFRPVYYISPKDVYYQNILVCSKNQCTLKHVNVVDEDKHFFENNYALEAWEGEDASMELLAKIEDFSIAAQPELPIFTKGNADQELLELCREGWTDRGLNESTKKDKTLKEIYTNRIKEELKVFKDAGGLANYILIVRDIMQFCKKNGQSCGLRGSAVGCLISYLIGISEVDPVIPDPTLPYSPARELLFSRFYSWVRNTPGNVSLPDCDMDVPISFRENIINYLKNKYGEDKIGYIITFARLDGRGAVKEVFRITEPVEGAFAIADAITKNMVDSSKVQDVLEDLKEENPDYNIIQFNIDHNPVVAEYYKEYKDSFETAIKMASTIKSTGRHAAGIVITNEPIGNKLPIAFDKNSGEKIVAYEMADLEYAGGVKFDLLGVAAYEKIDQICSLINSGKTQIEELI